MSLALANLIKILVKPTAQSVKILAEPKIQNTDWARATSVKRTSLYVVYVVYVVYVGYANAMTMTMAMAMSRVRTA